MAKDPESRYEAGGRGFAWLKIKTAHTSISWCWPPRAGAGGAVGSSATFISARAIRQWRVRHARKTFKA